MLSQKNVEAVTGIPARVFLDTIRAPGFPLPVTKLGKLRLVPREAFVAYLRARNEEPASPRRLLVPRARRPGRAAGRSRCASRGSARRPWPRGIPPRRPT
ncbi:hypothetical protein [Sorangium cellulosum]|uniref:Helix-turn-helix domain-containing protein n=1 Tax=Sorangium cellulosum So0157-2 TaxID=1254432 RepID=S4YBT3_SORCE|nr:hypothetical protein [Sorangium cellulosum]AGP40268.1 hypothetical protein SCE1572_40645 [Sorangium cellulosum So0157-2]